MENINADVRVYRVNTKAPCQSSVNRTPKIIFPDYILSTMATHQPLIRATGDITFTNPWENLGDKFRTAFDFASPNSQNSK